MPAQPDTTAPSGPLAGLRVLDISTVVAGPFASTLLADLGAEVLKVEMPGTGDALRRLAPHKDGVPLWWKVTNRNKRGITLDLRKPDGKALLGRLVADYDVLVGSYTQGKSEGIYRYRFDAQSGKLDAQPRQVIKSENPSWLTLSKDQRFVFAVNENGPGGSEMSRPLSRTLCISSRKGK